MVFCFLARSMNLALRKICNLEIVHFCIQWVFEWIGVCDCWFWLGEAIWCWAMRWAQIYCDGCHPRESSFCVDDVEFMRGFIVRSLMEPCWHAVPRGGGLCWALAPFLFFGLLCVVPIRKSGLGICISVLRWFAVVLFVSCCLASSIANC